MSLQSVGGAGQRVDGGHGDSAGGALSSLHTTVLLTVEETVAAPQKAAAISYRPPGGKV